MKKIFQWLTIFILGLGTLSSWRGEEEIFPKENWKDQHDPLASPDAEVGGEVVYYSGPNPRSFNYYLSLSSDTALFFGLLYDSLLNSDPITIEHIPAIAERWSIGEDKKTFTFYLNPKAKWSDGRPITAEDVKWTFDMITNPENMTGSWQILGERFLRVEIIDPQTVRFYGKEVHWSLLDDAGGLIVLPKHAWEGKVFKEVNFDFPVVSGPYRIEEHKPNRYVSFIRRDDWWARCYRYNQNKFNFQRIRFKFYEMPDTAFQAFLKGDLDILGINKAEIWIKKAVGDEFQRNWIIKQKIYNHSPIGFQGWAMNMRQSPFDDIRVRKAICHLIDRRTMNETLMFNQYFLHRSYYEDLYNTKHHPCPNPIIEFDVQTARQLLTEAGWRPNPKTGILEKDGTPFIIKFLERSPDSERFLVHFQQALSQVGIKLEIIRKDWSAWLKDMDEFNFMMTWAAWGAGVKKDPESMWSSKEGKRVGGNNITGFSDPRVDELIEQQKTIFDIQKRHTILREIDQIIYQTYPYALLWNINYHRILYWNKFGVIPTVLSKYGDIDSSLVYWWYDPDAESTLKTAQKNKTSLPSRPLEVNFDDVYSVQK